MDKDKLMIYLVEKSDEDLKHMYRVIRNYLKGKNKELFEKTKNAFGKQEFLSEEDDPMEFFTFVLLEISRRYLVTMGYRN